MAFREGTVEPTRAAREAPGPQGRLDGTLLVAGALPFALATAVAGVAALSFALGHPLSPATLPLGAGMAVVVVAWAARRSGVERRALLRGAAVFVVACAASIALALAFLDTSDDGQGYHLGAIARLAQGWNPWRELLTVGDTPNWLWLNHYPRGGWELGAAFVAATGRLEASKAVHLLFLSGALCLAVAAAGRVLPPRRAVAVGALAALSPVAVGQLCCNYVDGQIASTLTAEAAALVLTSIVGGALSVLAVVATVITAIGLKFTGAVYAVALAACGVAVALVWRDAAAARRVAAAAAVSALAAGLLLHANPYVTNTIRNGHPFYPVLGTPAFDVGGGLPAGYEEMNRVARLAHALFARSDQPPFSTPAAHLKLPFSFHVEEWDPIGLVDTRVGGFGPFFSGALLLALAVFLVSGRQGRLAALAAASVLATALLNAQAWWARYAPQVWLVPVVAICGGWASGRRRARVLAGLTAAVLALDAGTVAIASLSAQLRFSRRARSELARLRALPAPPALSLVPLYADAWRVRLGEAGVVYREVPPERCEVAYRIAKAEVCRSTVSP